jgi:hypothetical protein
VVYSSALLVLGIVLGRFTCQSGGVLPQIEINRSSMALSQAPVSELLREGYLQNVNLQELPDDKLQVSFRGGKDYEIVGDPQDQQIRELLAYILLNEKNDGMRMRSLEKLAQGSDTLAQNSLIYSLMNDENPGMRLKAIRSLHNFTPNSKTKMAYMKALMTDANPAVRIEAMTGLRKLILDEQVQNVVLIASQKDSNEYVKLLGREALESLRDKTLPENLQANDFPIEDLR